jgi:hypothetical protein
MKAGEELQDSASWKNRQTTTNSLIAIVGLCVTLAGYAGYKIDVSNDDLMAIAGGIAIVLGLCNSALTTATSKRVGLSAGVVPSANNGPEFTSGN